MAALIYVGALLFLAGGALMGVTIVGPGGETYWLRIVLGFLAVLLGLVLFLVGSVLWRRPQSD